MEIAGYINDQDRAELILHHGEITADDLPFGNKSNPFRITLLKGPSFNSTFGPAILDCLLIGDLTTSPLPVDDLRNDGDPLHPTWSHKNIVFIDDTENVHGLLDNFRLFWSSGDPSPIS